MLSNSEIDRLGDRLRAGEMDANCLRKLEAFRQLHVQSYEHVENVLVNRLKLAITGRPSKSTLAIVDKLKRETVRLSQIQDIAGCRVIVDGLLYQDRLLETMRLMLGDVRVDDKRTSPTHGYRAVHIIVTILGRPVEIQLRTNMQHAWANISEKVADDFGHSIKYGAGDPAALHFLSSLSAMTARLETIRRDKAVLSQKKRAIGNSKAISLESKALNIQERQCIREMRAIFAGK